MPAPSTRHPPRHPPRRRRAAAALGALLVSAAGCTPLRVWRDLGRSTSPGDALEVPPYDVPPPRPRGRFSAGAAAEDITPPPGFPTGGHGPAGRLARGQWMRLEARAFFFEDRAGRALALVSADLFAVPGGLRAEVARLVAESGADASLPPAALIIAATHTHHGPGNYLTARAYNQFGSSYSGFSAELLEFLARRLARAVVRAVEDARRHPEPVEVAVHVGRVDHGLVRNRAPRTFLLNRDRDELLAALDGDGAEPACAPRPGEPETAWSLPGCPRLKAADRTITVVEVARLAGATRTRAAALVFFAAHPTVLQPDTPLYTPDFPGPAVHALARRWGSAGREPVVGFFNGAEGDVTVRRTTRDLREALAVGEAFAAAAAATLRRPPVFVLADPEIAVRAAEVRPLDPEGGRCEGARLAPRPTFGAATLGGAEGDRTVLYDLGWRDGVRDVPRHGQGPKLPALDSQLVRALRFSDEFAPPDAFPETLPLTVADLGGLQLAAVPLELSTAQGQAVRRRLGRPHGRLEIVGLANEYASYCSTADEYAAQDYMGASTVWGPEEGRFVTCRLGELAASPAAAPVGRAPARRFLPGAEGIQRFGPAFCGDRVERPDEGLDAVLQDASGAPQRRLPWFAWDESDEPGVGFPTPPRARLSLWREAPEGWTPGLPEGPEDDRGPHFLTVYLGGSRWAALWLRPLASDVAGTFAFVAAREGAPWRCSRAFRLAPGTPLPDEVPEGPCPGAVAAPGAATPHLASDSQTPGSSSSFPP